jgi:adenine-specific DNA-methyltransferase
VLVCAIDENEFPSLALLIKEIFGELQFEHSYVSVVHNPRGQQGVNFSYVNEYLIFVYPNDGKKYIADFPKDEVDSRNLRDSGTESDRTDARSCFYPFIVKGGKIDRIGDVPENDFHPGAANIPLACGGIEIWPVTDGGDEKKWRYARQTVESILPKLEPKMGRKNVQIIFNKDSGTMRSVWSNARYDSSEYGTKLLDKLFGGASFTFPKSLWTVYDCVWAVTQNDKNAIVMDFFSGSATTAHAVMQLNASDNGKRKYIMVQLPEDLDMATKKASDAKTRKAIKSAIEFLDSAGKRRTICELGKERIRRASALIKQEKPPVESQNIDAGFRVLKLDSSNIKDDIKPDRTPEDLLFQAMLDLGILLSSKIEKRKIDGSEVFFVMDNHLNCLLKKPANFTVL